MNIQEPEAGPDTSGKAKTSLILGILSVVLCLGPFTGIPALILGLKAKNGADPKARNHATIGIVLGLAGIGLFMLVILGGILRSLEEQALKEQHRQAEEQARQKYELLVREGTEALKLDDFQKAYAKFKEALLVPNYKGSQEQARQGMTACRIMLGQVDDQFLKSMMQKCSDDELHKLEDTGDLPDSLRLPHKEAETKLTSLLKDKVEVFVVQRQETRRKEEDRRKREAEKKAEAERRKQEAENRNEEYARQLIRNHLNILEHEKTIKQEHMRDSDYRNMIIMRIWLLYWDGAKFAVEVKYTRKQYNAWAQEECNKRYGKCR